MEKSKRLLLIDESKSDRHGIRKQMAMCGWEMRHVMTIEDANQLLVKERFEVGLISLPLDIAPLQSALESLVDCHDIEWVAIIERNYLMHDGVRKALSQLFYAYHLVPVDYRQLDCLLHHAMNMAHLSNHTFLMSKVVTHDHEMVSETPCMQKLFENIRKVATVDAPIYISGESGTGKELAARAIHQYSRRTEGPFIAVNCGALPSELIHTELFGHEKGAFTDANRRKVGRIEAASGGTLFLDEIGDLPVDIQVTLLRLLESYQIRRLSGMDEIRVDIKVIVATHVDLEKAIDEGRFREDLYHRLNVLRIHMPPLRERPKDIELLANLFFQKFSKDKSEKLQGFSQEALECMKNYKWPGNVRELINRVRRAMVMCDNKYITPEDLQLETHCTFDNVITLEQARDLAEKRALQTALIRNNNKILHAAKELGVSRVTLYRLIDKHGINRDEILYGKNQPDNPMNKRA
ncbi:sigma-54-dependent Fis family transcriptional regulator [Litchfieldella qijiaojingensis]|uniref:Sigma-54-dependent Fis family transcriptional regulator n=1 Tax=Litchfieldella qijiaojingensis TaxID=980347 RepID=A0ABQ2YHA6_9GAMM|nr:sigma-54 dependent transcriptional regulator [Halomonas qijiaojingensis]GGX83659.1 sigma-54-dependent Fis family transcriptional regulator [Halomonas qijiaojingensis]